VDDDARAVDVIAEETTTGEARERANAERRARRERRPRETRVERQVRDERARTLGALGNVARMRRARETGGERWRVRAGGNG